MISPDQWPCRTGRCPVTLRAGHECVPFDHRVPERDVIGMVDGALAHSQATMLGLFRSARSYRGSSLLSAMLYAACSGVKLTRKAWVINVPSSSPLGWMMQMPNASPASTNSCEQVEWPGRQYRPPHSERTFASRHSCSSGTAVPSAGNRTGWRRPTGNEDGR